LTIIEEADAWRRRAELERRAGNITPTHELVLVAFWRRALLGDTAPSEAAIAAEVGCCIRTVQRAKQRGRALELLQWERQQTRDEQNRLLRERPCAYRITTPTQPVRERQFGARTETKKKEEHRRSSIAAQIAALPAPTPAILALQAERRRRLGLI
jgi:AraC-like DNA-binding protein